MARDGIRLIWTALLASTLAASAKLIAAKWSGSSTLAAETIHSLVAATSQVMMLRGVLPRERAPANDIYFWSLVVGVLLYSLGAGVAIHEGVAMQAASAAEAIVRPTATPPVAATPQPSLSIGAAIPALVLSLVAIGYVTWRALAEVDHVRGQAPAIEALRKHREPTLFTLVATSIAALCGLAVALIALMAAAIGVGGADAIGAIAVGLVQGATAATLALEIRNTLNARHAPRDKT